MIFEVLGWLLFGLIVGWLARFLVPGSQTMGWLMTSLLGIAGSFVGGSISWLLFGTPTGNINPAGWIMSVIGAIIVVLLYIRLNDKSKPVR